MQRGLLVVALCLLGTASAFTGLRGKGQQKMQPEVVARTLTQVERKWMDEAMTLRACDKANATSAQTEECESAERSFVGSCQKVAEAIVQGSEGDRQDAQDYMDDVCGQPELKQEQTPQRLCSAFANAVLESMGSDTFSNREGLDTRKICEGFVQRGELRTIAEEELVRQEKEEARIEEEKRKEAEEEAQRKEQQAKAEEAKKAEEEAEKAKQEAAEKKAKAEQAKAEQEKKAQEAAKKAEELKAAEAEANAALEHVKNVSSSAAAAAPEKAVKEATNATKTVTTPEKKDAAKPAEQIAAPAKTEQTKQKKVSLVKVQSCDAQQQKYRSLIQEKLAVFGVQCEEMCKEMGVYPKCQCPGFAGQPADADDNRACIAKNCQDPTNPCPNDAFMTCVHETTKVSTLQWDALIQKFDVTMEAYKTSLAALKGPLRCPAPLFVAEGQFCVCKDPDNCPSTAETLTPEQAAQLAAEAHTWNQSGAPGTR